MSIYIEKLSFIAGHKTDLDPLELSPGSITILVGPNNSGKSQTLRDVEELCTGKIDQGKILQSLELIYQKNREGIEKILRPFEIKSNNSMYRSFRKPSLHNSNKQQINHDLQSYEIDSFVNNLDSFKKKVVPFYLERLDGRTRFSLVEEKPINDLKEPSTVDYLSALFIKDEIRKEIREITKEAFNLYFVIDRTGNKLCIRMSQQAPLNDKIERGADNESIEFHKNADLITDLGDGIQAFVGLVAGLFGSQDTIILIDEPEAFLADPIARKLGRELVRIAQKRKASLIVATHNADFVMGCIETSDKPNIIRLTYENPKATARQIETDIIGQFNTNPCLRSSSAIRGLFHKGVIVTEGHRDRVFYDEVNHRLIEYSNGKGTDDVLFIDSGGGINMIYKTVEPLRKMGIPAVAVVDIDFIIKPEKEWKNLINACQINEKEQEKQLKNERDEIIKAFKAALNLFVKDNLTEEEKKKEEAKLKEEMKKKGINIFSNLPESYNKLQNFIELLCEYGLFIVPIGELESWIPELKKGSEWDERWHDKMGQPEKNNFNDWWGLNKWSFMNKIAAWINDPDRKGVM